MKAKEPNTCVLDCARKSRAMHIQRIEKEILSEQYFSYVFLNQKLSESRTKFRLIAPISAVAIGYSNSTWLWFNYTELFAID